jgi:hypothetical protein
MGCLNLRERGEVFALTFARLSPAELILGDGNCGQAVIYAGIVCLIT